MAQMLSDETMDRVAESVPATPDRADADARTVGRPAPVSRARLYLALSFGIVCISLSAILTWLSGLPGTVSGFYRIAIALIALSPLFVRDVARGRVATDRRVWILALAAGIFFALDIALWNTSLFITSAATATLLGNDAPIFVGLVALVIFRERLGGSYWIGLAVALVGMGIIAGPDLVTGSRVGGGDALAALAGVVYALYLVLTQRVRAGMSTLPSLWVPALSGALLLLLFNVATQRALWGFSAHAWLMLILVGLVSQVAGWLAINYALGHLPASIVSPTLLCQPVLTALFAVPLLAQPLGGSQIVGGVVALAGIYLVNRGFNRR
jgi:drug/metabolite transporter (DMT)-like permease